MSNTEKLLEEFLAKGGQITKCPPAEDKSKPQVVKSINPGPAQLMSLSEGDLFYGEKSKRKRKVKEPDLTDINISDIPEEVRKALGI
jgi:hypothetical protein